MLPGSVLENLVSIRSIRHAPPSDSIAVEDMVSQSLGPTAMPSFILHYFDFRIDHYRVFASYHDHLRICHEYTFVRAITTTFLFPADVYSQQ